MNESEIAEIMQLTVSDLFELCQNRELVGIAFSIAIQNGIQIGRMDSDRYHGIMLKGYNGVSIQN